PDVKKWLAEEAYAEPHGHHGHGHAHDHAHDHNHDHAHLDRSRHDDHIASFVLTTDKPIPAGNLEMFLELLRANYGTHLLRVKGIAKLAEAPDAPVVVHGVQHLFHPTARLERWPDDDRRSRIVFITRDLPECTVRDLFEAFLGAAAIDRPDKAALTDNPLVPFGGVDR
ncbi:MAG: GTP-binding protein, partial [Pseudolabrys sp.]